MEYFKLLKEKFPFYLSSGIICAILIFLLAVLNNYSGHLEVKLSNMKNMALNKQKVISQVKEIDAAAAYLKEEFDLDLSNIDPDALIFEAIDEIKNNLKGSTLRVSSIKDPDNKRTYNVDIEMPVKDYSMLVQSFHYLESLRIPKYKINNFSVRKEKPGEMLLRISGNLVMPSL